MACPGDSEEEKAQKAAQEKSRRNLGIALAGPGNYSEGEPSPALGKFDRIKENPAKNSIYSVANATHAEYAERAAQAGKHFCENHMAVTGEECHQMMAACKEVGKKLSTGYRLHFEPYNVDMTPVGNKKPFGNIKPLKADDVMGSVDCWRLHKKQVTVLNGYRNV